MLSWIEKKKRKREFHRFLKKGEYPFLDEIVEDKIEGLCHKCGHTEVRAPEELEPGAVCPKCDQPYFNGPPTAERVANRRKGT